MRKCDIDRHSLPHGAKGIESDDFAIEFRADKVVFIVKSGQDGRHYTFHAGPTSILDLHEATEDARGEAHRTLFGLRHEDLPTILGQFVPMVEELLGLLRPLRLGWLKHNNIGIARGVDPVSDEDIALRHPQTQRPADN